MLLATIAANDRCRMDGRRTLAAEDLLAAMRALGLDQYHDVLRDYIIKYREVSTFSHLAALHPDLVRQLTCEYHQLRCMTLRRPTDLIDLLPISAAEMTEPRGMAPVSLHGG